jgi:DNA polymerase III delta prime subunit
MTLKKPSFLPLAKMIERVDIAREDSEASLFSNLLYLGEFTSKIIVTAFVAGISEDTERQRYRQLHRLVRADGIGEWSEVLRETLSGSASQLLNQNLQVDQKEFNQKFSQGSWQHSAITQLHNCLRILDPNCEPLNNKLEARKFVEYFARLRNTTRGHGAPTNSTIVRLCPILEESLDILIENCSLFQKEWAYLYQNLSGKYRIIRLSDRADSFEYLKSNKAMGTPSLVDGVYIFLDSPILVELIYSNQDIGDFYVPNGGFSDKKFELLSYISSNKLDGESVSYLQTPSTLPGSETKSLGSLELIDNVFTNMPTNLSQYINRNELENELYNVLTNERHPIITLIGRGGIGKTSLALTVLRKLCCDNQFDVIAWFSARDVDLLAQGARNVKPDVVNKDDISRTFVELMEPSQAEGKGFKAVSFFEESLTKSSIERPILFVFDNFETVANPKELYVWIDSFIRLPNKVLITTRMRDFKADYHIDVPGMSEEESDALVEVVSSSLGIKHFVNAQYKKEVYSESEGHPYVIKILLGEVAKANKKLKVERIIGSGDEILNALFERTYAGLSTVAKRVFLTLSNWKSTIPLLALESVLLRPANERMNVKDAVEELNRSSLIEVKTSVRDEELFLSVPLVTSIFGRQKFLVSPLKSVIEVDVRYLQAFGASQLHDIRLGIAPRIKMLYSSVNSELSRKRAKLEDYLPVLEFVSRRFPEGWLFLAELYEETGTGDYLLNAAEALRNYLASPDATGKRPVWRKLAQICQKTKDFAGEVHALLEECCEIETPFSAISYAANRLNALFKEYNYLELDTDSEEKEIVVNKLKQIMESRIYTEGDATDCSRIAWLCIHLKDIAGAKRFVEKGLEIDEFNEHCSRLHKRLFV